MSVAKFQRTGKGIKTEQRGDTLRRTGDESVEIDKLLNIKEAAAVLGVVPGSLYHMVSQRRVPCVRISNRCLRFSKTALGKFISEKSFPATKK
jgi:hypothetical protein